MHFLWTLAPDEKGERVSIIFDPTNMLKKAAPESKIKKMVSSRFSVKRTILATLGTKALPLDQTSILSVALKTMKAYKDRISKAKDIEASAGNEIKKEIIKDPRQLIQRVQNAVIFQVHKGIKEKYAGEKARWLPSDATEPRPEHQKYYGKIYTIGEGIDGEEPGDLPGCKCGVEIITNETQLDLS